MKTEKINFNADPLQLTKTLLSIYVEKNIYEERHPFIQKCFYSYLETLSDSELEEILEQFIEKQKVEFITFEDFEGDFKVITAIIEDSPRFSEIYNTGLKNQLIQYEFEEGKGLSGVLLATGEFIKCGYQQHSVAVNFIDWDSQNKAIYFSCRRNGDEQGVVSFSPLNSNEEFSDAQKDWILNHLQFFDSNQLTHLRWKVKN